MEGEKWFYIRRLTVLTVPLRPAYWVYGGCAIDWDAVLAACLIDRQLVRENVLSGSGLTVPCFAAFRGQLLVRRVFGSAATPVI